MIRSASPAGVTLLQAAALLPPVAVAVLARGAGAAAVLAVALLSTLIWDLVFARARAGSLAWHSVTTGLILAVAVPPDVPLWQVALAASFGVVLGEQVFGGRGFGFLSPAVAALAFLAFSFPGTGLAGAEPAVAAAAVPGLVLLFAAGLVFWRLLAGFALGLCLATLLASGALPAPSLAVSLCFGAVFLLADPVAAAATQAGRWIHGLTAGGLVVLLADMGPVNALVFAALLASLAAPLVDHLVIRALARRRDGRRRHV
ncbi:RnfABCDGE type electron transport complex subunit D [Defluviimonas sp. WL0024]|uniref:RnfABCDGE type electron transport complex subunit D n=1 Tax=Albidovulum salinarum TaxID=2984153 RepID=A0ABT2X0T1_9RHOB|nr:RnfABCDGE type electron transport complex subunit D [Defluviimonas sp. WL0024]MCU9847544.1 RnfABCDGE type electron transport complex subunit D [Defluviimonas sp. WL0024]